MKKVKTILVLACLAAMILVLSACGTVYTTRISGPIDWPTEGLATLLPEPDDLTGEIRTDGESRFAVDIDASETNYKKYVKACEDCGFTVEADKGSSTYKAFNEDGYKLSLAYYPTHEYYIIYLDAPLLEDGQTFSWPTAGPATLVPEPTSDIGDVLIDSSREFSVYVGEFSPEEYTSYVSECIEAGFALNYSRTDTSYSAENEDGDSLSVSYEGFNVCRIHIRSAEEMEVDEEEAEDEGSTDDADEADEESTDDAIEEEEETLDDADEAEEETPDDAIEEEEETPDDAVEADEETRDDTEEAEEEDTPDADIEEAEG